MRDPISSATHFAKSLYSEPGQTLKSTWEGVRHVGEIEGVYKYTTPLLGGAGLFLAFAGATTGDPVALTFGTANVAVAGGHFLEHEQSVEEGRRGNGPPPPAPPV